MTQFHEVPNTVTPNAPRTISEPTFTSPPPPPAKQWVRLIAPGIDVRVELLPETITGLVKFVTNLAANPEA